MVLYAYNPYKPEDKITILAHIDAVVNFESEIKGLLNKIPAEYKIEAGVYTSNQANNPYTQLEILYQLKISNRTFEKIETETESVTNLAVELTTGKVISTNTPTIHSYNTDLPIRISYTDIAKENPSSASAWEELLSGIIISKRTKLLECYGENIEFFKNSANISTSPKITESEKNLADSYLEIKIEKLLLNGLSQTDFDELQKITTTLKAVLEKNELSGSSLSELFSIMDNEAIKR